MAGQSPRVQVRAWIKEQIVGCSEVRLPELADQAVAHFRQNELFLSALLIEQLRPIVYEQARIVAQDTRLIVLGDEIVTSEQLTERAGRLRSRWEAWLEHVGDRHIRLLDMTRDDLLLAAEERRRRADSELEIARLWRKLAARLKPGETVGQRFTPQEIDAARAALHQAPALKQSKQQEEAA